MFDEVYEDRVPWLLWNRELLQSSVWLIARCLRSPANHTRFTVVLNEALNARLRILTLNEVECLIKVVVSGERMIMLVPEHSEPEVGVVRNVDAVVEKE